ncbi:cytosolic sulfotransferase 5-like [Amaranthus tricolor]|uniref:cytosolic sulfotransferase 5-like n=1 Tax=Amaranthus tricolor TaxID=29722 RepID=UPI002584E894|nr:cytosolic sulfotransferase 5-like [Amaranthus tricolor]
MANSEPTQAITKKQFKDEDEEQNYFGFPMVFYHNFWCLNVLSNGVKAFQRHFQAQNSDIILASLPKTGTTWLKSILFAILNRRKYEKISQLPFNTITPHELVLHLELEVYKNFTEHHPITNPPNVTELPSPRLFGTHMPYSALPESIKSSNCRIVYVCRNPFDTFISLWHFYLKFDINKSNDQFMEERMMEDYVRKFCNGISPFGPYEDHLYGFWKESKENPKKVLLLEYEGLKKEPKDHLRKIAEFVGFPFSIEEEKENVVDEIIELCSIKSMKEMEINKNGKFYPWVENKALFRKGDVGDWTNYLSPSMVNQIQHIMDNLNNKGFSFMYYQI